MDGGEANGDERGEADGVTIDDDALEVIASTRCCCIISSRRGCNCVGVDGAMLIDVINDDCVDDVTIGWMIMVDADDDDATIGATTTTSDDSAMIGRATIDVASCTNLHAAPRLHTRSR